MLRPFVCFGKQSLQNPLQLQDFEISRWYVIIFGIALPMTRLDKNARTAFYRKGLEDHRYLIRSAVERMAAGDLVHAISIAVSIRALIHETGASKPVLKHLRPDYLSIPIHTAKEPESAPPPPNVQKATVLKISANLMLSEGRVTLQPTLDLRNCEARTLGHWWTHTGLIVPGGTPLSRKEIILGIANKEGAHLDDDMPRAYRIFLESKSIRIKVNDSDFEAIDLTRYVCGTAGVELLECLDRNFPKDG